MSKMPEEETPEVAEIPVEKPEKTAKKVDKGSTAGDKMDKLR